MKKVLVIILFCVSVTYGINSYLKDNDISTTSNNITPNVVMATEPKTEYDFKPIERHKNYNEELQYYLPDNVKINDKSIKIISKKENIIDKEYTSGMVESKKAYKYGKFEFDISVSMGKGIFPAIWMMPNDGSTFPEVDIFEMIGSEDYIFYGVIHYMENGEKRKTSFDEYVGKKDKYKTSIDWTRDSISWYIDGKLMLKIDEGVPNDYMYIIVNQAVGGIWPGSPDNNTEFPSEFNIQSYKLEPVYEKNR